MHSEYSLLCIYKYNKHFLDNSDLLCVYLLLWSHSPRKNSKARRTTSFDLFSSNLVTTFICATKTIWGKSEGKKYFSNFLPPPAAAPYTVLCKGTKRFYVVAMKRWSWTSLAIPVYETDPRRDIFNKNFNWFLDYWYSTQSEHMCIAIASLQPHPIAMTLCTYMHVHWQLTEA